MSETRQYPRPESGDNSRSKNTAAKPKKGFGKYVLFMWGAYFGVLALGILFFLGVSKGMFGELPSFVELESPKSSLASEIYSSDGKLLGKFFIEDRSNTDFEELPQHLIDALVCTEDVRFYDHSGIDLRGTFALVYYNFFLGIQRGSSTITQQLAKNLFHDRPGSTFRRIQQKFKEWVIAVRLERSYTKDEIISMYLNTVAFSNNAYGIKTAATRYFAAEPSTLNLQDGAILVGMLKGSTLYNPKRNPERSTERRNTVIQQMHKYGRLTTAERDSLIQAPLVLKYTESDHNYGLGTYFREHLREESKRWAKNNIKVDGSTYDIYQDGLRIYTTIDSRMQGYAEKSLKESMTSLQKQFEKHWSKKDPWHEMLPIERVHNSSVKKGAVWAGINEAVYRGIKRSDRYSNWKRIKKTDKEIFDSFNKPVKMSIFSWEGDIDTLLTPLDSVKYYKRFLQSAFMAVDPETGDVKAWVGGNDIRHFKFDNVKADHQVGSTFKPFVYTMAVQNGWSPCRTVPNVPVTFEQYDNWTPKNAGDHLDGQWVTLKTGLAHSINRVTAQLMKQITPDPVVELVSMMGIEDGVEPLPSICLGTPELKLSEMLGAYTTYANAGFYSKPRIITRIEDKNGNLIQSFPSIKKEVIDEHTAYVMVDLLSNVTNNGTGRRIRYKYNISAPVAGKTGTTNENSDGWYIGLVPKLVAGAWVGGDEKTIRFRETRYGCGAHMALPIWANFMKQVYADETLGITEEDLFERPENLAIEVDCSKYLEVNPETGLPMAAGAAPANGAGAAVPGMAPIDPGAALAPAPSSNSSTKQATDPNATNTRSNTYDYNSEFD